MQERIQAIIKKEGITPSRFADIIGVQRSGISHILSGRNKPSLDFLNKVLIHFPNISGDWLITGQGEMLKNKVEKRSFKQLTIPGRATPEPKREEETIEPISDNKVELMREEVHTAPKQPHAAAQSVIDKPELFTASGKKIERILVFYDDKTFREYSPE